MTRIADTGIYLAPETYSIASKYLLSLRTMRRIQLGAGELRGPMKLDWFVKCLLIVIALLLEVVAFRPVVRPAPVLAQGGSPYRFHIEQAAVSLKKPDGTVTWGKVGGRHAQRRRLEISREGAEQAIPRFRDRRCIEGLTPNISRSDGV